MAATDAAALRLDLDAIDLWLASEEELAERAQSDADLPARLRALLSAEERERETRFHFAHDRSRFLLTRALVRSVLSRYAPLAPQAWAFENNAYGRPRIAAALAEAHSATAVGDDAHAQPALHALDFNLSHTRGLVALAVGRRRAIGIDVEHVAARTVSPRLARRYFSTREADALADVAEPLRQERFFEYWTFKESYIKARGMGMSLPLERFSFDYPAQDAVRLAIDAELEDAAERWSLWQYRPSGDHLLALCAERGETPPQVRLRRVLPLVYEQALTLAPTRRSPDGDA
jgi:4'-phosphopantetheinyl transferase